MFQNSVPEESINLNSNWTSLKVFRKNVESEIVLYQFLLLSVGDLQLVNEKLPEMIKETLQF